MSYCKTFHVRGGEHDLSHVLVAHSVIPHNIDKLELNTLYKYPYPVRRFQGNDTLYDGYMVIEKERTIKVRDVIYIPAGARG